ncbi:SGNH/GDSL hydrolase family protein [Microbacterium sp.]|uniref:SGNH/GDSL hydrolase family protein n=1 Tax=Microbacterium sp. TaxID=51671 RepID=UPI003A8A2244
MASVRLVALGDSFTEGVGDELPNGRVRGWADLAAQGWAASRGEPIQYANLAIRGKLVWPIVDEQLERALSLEPTHLSFNGGGNDMLRPRAPIERIADAFTRVRDRCRAEGVTLVVLSGANPSGQLPLRRLIQRRGDALSRAVLARLDGQDTVMVLNRDDTELAMPTYWAADRLHMNFRGHHRVAARVLDAVGERVPDGWWSQPELPGWTRLSRTEYLRDHLGPWVRRRLTGTSSGDGREPKHPSWVTVAPEALD